MFLILSKLTEESWLVNVENTPPKQHDFGLSSRSVLQNSKTACHTWNKAKYLNNCAEKYKRFICHAAFNKTLLMLRIVSKSPIHSFILPERGNPCKERKKRKALIKIPPMGPRAQHFNTYKNGSACSASFFTDHRSRKVWKWIHGLFHSSSLLRHERKAVKGCLGNCYLPCLFLFWWKILCKGEECLGKYQWMENKGDFWGITLFQWGPGHTKFYPALHTLSQMKKKTLRVQKQDISRVKNTLYSIISLILLLSRSRVCEIPE